MPTLAKPKLLIVTPGTREANNGNWRTAERWRAMLLGHFTVTVSASWHGEPADALIALHARKSSASIEAFRAAHPRKRIALVLTGTDLYQDYPENAQAVASMLAADRLVVLQEDAPRLLPAALRAKCEVIFQSSLALRKLPKRRGVVRAVVVGHLRAEKSPETAWQAMGSLPRELPIRILHIGSALDAKLARQARDLARHDDRYQWCGALPHGLARIAIQRAHVLVHPSRLEGGANVIAEAVASGTPLLASRMSGNVGMLGESYPGYFPVGGSEELAMLLRRCLDESRFLENLQAACNLRKALFEPAAEARAVRKLADYLLA